MAEPKKITTNLGRVSILPKGEYNPLISYGKLDIVTYNYNTYLCVNDTTAGIVPTNVGYWMELVRSIDGREVELRVNETHIQKRYEGEEWSNLLPLSAIKGDSGKDAFVPIANVVKIGDKTTITITDEIDTTTEEVIDGYSPSANITKDGKVATITITDKNGTTEENIADGEHGKSGVEIGETEPTDPDVNVWLSPNGETDEANYTKGEVDILLNAKAKKPTIYTQGNILILDGYGEMIDSGMPLHSIVDSWEDVQRIVRAGMASKIFTVGEQLECKRGNDILIWVIIGFDHDIPADAKYTHSMTLQLLDCYKVLQFDATEALYYAENELPAGTYNFSLLAGYDTTYGGGKTYYFTLTEPVPEGGQIMFPWGYQIQAETIKISTYASNTTTTAIESGISVTEGDDGTPLTPTNHTHRIRYGSNNWLESAMRQWLNSDATAGNVWIPQTIYDRPPSWRATEAGFLYGIDADFLAVIGDVTKRTAKNTVYDGGGYIDLPEKIFLLARGEVGGTNEGGIIEGIPYEYYNNMLVNGVRSDAAIEARIKYLSGSPRYWWLRSPIVSSANYVRRVYTTGTVYYYHASSAYGVSPACNII